MLWWYPSYSCSPLDGVSSWHPLNSLRVHAVEVLLMQGCCTCSVIKVPYSVTTCWHWSWNGRNFPRTERRGQDINNVGVLGFLPKKILILCLLRLILMQSESQIPFVEVYVVKDQINHIHACKWNCVELWIQYTLGHMWKLAYNTGGG